MNRVANYNMVEDEWRDDQVGHVDAPNPLIYIWRALMRWKWLILAVLASAVLLGLLVTMMTTPLYTAQTQLEISRKQVNVTNVEGLQDMAAKDLEFYQTQYGLLQSRSLAERVAKKLKLAENPTFLAAYGMAPESGGGLFAERRPGAMTADERQGREKAAIGILLGNVAIVPVRGSSLVNVQFTSPDPALSAMIANTWAEQYIQSNFDRRFESTADARKLLEGRLADLKQRIDQGERALVAYAEQKGIIQLDTVQSGDGKTQTQRTLVGSDLETLNTALTIAKAERIAAESRLRTGGATSTEQLQMNPTLTGLRQQRATAQGEYAKLMVQFEPEYPAAKALASQIATLDRAITREESLVTRSVQVGYDQAVQRERELQARVNGLKTQLMSQRRDIIQYNIYQGEVDASRELYDGLLQRYKEIGVAGVGTSDVAVVDKAQPPGAPSSPRLFVNLILALMTGMAISGAAVFILQQIDESIKNPADVNNLLGMPVLGTIPEVDPDTLDSEMADRKSSIADAYLAVQTSLSFVTDHGVPKTLMFTSTEAAEGKTSSAIALSQSLARTGRKVLLIDADMRSPSLSERMGITHASGLSNYLAGDDNWKQMTVAAKQGPAVLLTGPQPPNAAELLISDRFAKLLADASQHFDHVVIDSPPVLGLADAPLIGSNVEMVIFVVQASQVKARTIRGALDRLRGASVDIAGVVLTRFNEKADYGYGYGYDYGYGKTENGSK